jgi:hypothetical protein
MEAIENQRCLLPVKADCGKSTAETILIFRDLSMSRDHDRAPLYGCLKNNDMKHFILCITGSRYDAG